MTKLPKIKLVRLRGRNQITLPASVIESLSLEEGDYLAAVLGEEGIIRLRPAKMVTAGTPEAEQATNRAKADLRAGRSEKFESVEDFTNAMLARHREQMSELTPSRTTMLVHVGTASTSASVQQWGVPIFTRSIRVGSANGSTAEMIDEVRKTVAFFQSHVGEGKIDLIFLSVGPPRLGGLALALELALGIRVRELAPVTTEASSVTLARGEKEDLAVSESINIESKSFPQQYKTSS